jgi:hypothetical protein
VVLTSHTETLELTSSTRESPMSPNDLDLVITIVASLLVLACGAGAVLILPWDYGKEIRPPVPEPEPLPKRSVLPACPWVEAT